MKKLIIHIYFISLIFLLIIAPAYSNPESGMLHHNYLNNKEHAAERERKNMVKGMVFPMFFLNFISVAYERNISYHSGIHLSANLITFISFETSSGIAYLFNTEYRYYLRTKNSIFFYNFYPYGFMMFTSDIKEFSPVGLFGIGIGRQNPLHFFNERLYLDINIGVGWWGVDHKGFFTDNFFLKPGLLFAYRF